MHCAGDEFYNKKLENLVDAETGVVTTINVFECQFCQTTWTSMTGTKRMAHLCQLSGHGVIPCKQTKSKISPTLVERLLPLWAGGQQHLKAREAVQKDKAAKSSAAQANQKKLTDCVDDIVAKEVTDLLSRAHHDAGNIPDQFWGNKHLQRALCKLAECKPMQFKTPSPKQMAGPLLKSQMQQVQDLVDNIFAGQDCNSLSMDGWDHVVKNHWLAQSIIGKRRPFFKSAVDCTDVPSMDGAWTQDTLETFIKEIGLNLVVAIILDGPNVNKGALKRIEQKYPAIACLLCICHCLSIFFKNVFKLPVVKKIFAVVNNTGNKFRNVKFLREKLLRVQSEDEELKTLKKFKTVKGYLRTSGTRFGSKHTCTERALLINDATERVVMLRGEP